MLRTLAAQYTAEGFDVTVFTSQPSYNDFQTEAPQPRAIYRYAYPSKLAMYLEAGCRVLAVVEGASELARLVEDTKVGASCPPGDPRGVAEAILQEYERSRTTEPAPRAIRAADASRRTRASG